MSLVAENIVVSFSGRDVLKGVTIRADKGKVTGLLGRNGCGKSTVLKAIFGTQRAEDKIVQYKGKTINTPYTSNGLLNYLPQFPFFPKGLKISRALKDFCVEDKRILEAFPDLAPDLSRTFDELSGGMERLVSVLILLYAPTEFTLLDEPFTHIMPLHVDKLKEVILSQKEHKGIILTDHMYRHITELSDRIYLIRNGYSVLIRNDDGLQFHGYLNSLAG
jgi:ABC-type multidrug transport system ATPase subunit